MDPLTDCEKPVFRPDEVKVWTELKEGLLNFADTHKAYGWLVTCRVQIVCTDQAHPNQPTMSSDPYKPGVGGAWAQCKCRSSDPSREPGWHHEQPSWNPQQQQQAHQMGIKWGHPSFLFFSFLFVKLFPSQLRAKTGWQGSFQIQEFLLQPW